MEQTIRRMTLRKALEQWETEIRICQVTAQALWPIVKPLMKRDERNSPTAPYGALGTTYHPNKKTKVIADYLANHLAPHDLCDESHERQVETSVRDLLASVEGTPLEKVRPCNIHKSKSKAFPVTGREGP
jgi:hypothetical protein